MFYRRARIWLNKLQIPTGILLFHIWFTWNLLLYLLVLFQIEGHSSIKEVCLASVSRNLVVTTTTSPLLYLFDLDLKYCYGLFQAIKYFIAATSKTWIQTLDSDPEKTWPQKNLDPEEPRPRKTWTMKNLDPEKPGFWKTWTQKNLDLEKPGPRKTWTLKNVGNSWI